MRRDLGFILLVLPALRCDSAIFAAQVKVLAPFVEIVVADVLQHESIAAMARP